MNRTVVATDALWQLVERAGRHPDPDLRAAATALLKSGTHPAPPRRTHLSPQEAAELLGVSITTVYRRVADGTWPHERVGQLIRIPTSVVNRRQPSPTVTTHLGRGPAADDTAPNDESDAA